jgi:hypothetical protein
MDEASGVVDDFCLLFFILLIFVFPMAEESK